MKLIAHALEVNAIHAEKLIDLAWTESVKILDIDRIPSTQSWNLIQIMKRYVETRFNLSAEHLSIKAIEAEQLTATPAIVHFGSALLVDDTQSGDEVVEKIKAECYEFLIYLWNNDDSAQISLECNDEGIDPVPDLDQQLDAINAIEEEFRGTRIAAGMRVLIEGKGILRTKHITLGDLNEPIQTESRTLVATIAAANFEKRTFSIREAPRSTIGKVHVLPSLDWIEFITRAVNGDRMEMELRRQQTTTSKGERIEMISYNVVSQASSALF